LENSLKAYLTRPDDNKEEIKRTVGPLLNDIVIADNFFKRFIGLIFRKEISSEEGLILEDCYSIHTFWMRFPVDVIFLDSYNTIIRIYHSLKPFRITPVVQNAKRVLELKAGVARKLCLKVNDSLELIN
jgi:uncharacterized membrane protein (UPF0127 family)